MKNVLALIGSPRKLGNCETAAKALSRQISEPHQLRLLRISDFNIGLCTGCYTCLLKNKCVLKDDLPMVIEAFVEADAFIIAVPTYCLGANASLKLLADRALAFYSRHQEIWGKPAVALAVAGMEGKEGYTKLNIDSFMRLFQMRIKGSEILYGALPGEVRLNETNNQAIERLAAALFGQTPAPSGPVCPVCGGDTFRFYENNRIRCMLCSNEGNIETNGPSPVFHIQPSSHELFLSHQDAVNHGEWLRAMKIRFRHEKDRLKQVTREFEDYGEWIKPNKPSL